MLSIFLLASFAASSIAAPVQNFQQIDATSATTFLSHFGYVKPGSLSSDLSELHEDSFEESFATAIKQFQQSMGLENTGLLDDSTKKAMTARRCGRPDVAHSGELRWHKNRLTYFVEDGGNHLSRDDARSALKEAIAKWSSVIPLDFVEVGNSDEADLKIGFRTGRHDDEDSFDGPGTILAHAFYPTDGHVHFDDDEEWVVKDTGRIREGAADLVGVATHELGHALGFDHVYGSAHKDDIMFPSWSPNFDSNGNYVPNRLTDNDIQVAQAIYGVRNNNNGGGGDDGNDGGDNGGEDEIPRRLPTQPKWNFPTFDFGDDDKNPDDFFKNFMNNIPHTPGFHKFNFGDGNPTNGGFFHDDGNGNQQWSYHWESSSGRK